MWMTARENAGVLGARGTVGVCGRKALSANCKPGLTKVFYEDVLVTAIVDRRNGGVLEAPVLMLFPLFPLYNRTALSFVGGMARVFVEEFIQHVNVEVISDVHFLPFDLSGLQGRLVEQLFGDRY